MKKRWGIFCGAAVLVLLYVLLAMQSQTSPVTKLVIHPDSISLVPGVRMQLDVEGYTEDGRIATAKQCQALALSWDYKVTGNAFTVSEDGVLTAISSGIGNVWVQSGDGKLSSRPITVFVK
ncbi:MAG: hypothetical protein AB7D36_03180 [Oscillospiraceae bacterium]